MHLKTAKHVISNNDLFFRFRVKDIYIIGHNSIQLVNRLGCNQGKAWFSTSHANVHIWPSPLPKFYHLIYYFSCNHAISHTSSLNYKILITCMNLIWRAQTTKQTKSILRSFDMDTLLNVFTNISLSFPGNLKYSYTSGQVLSSLMPVMLMKSLYSTYTEKITVLQYTKDQALFNSI